jgi:hypothetical protein
MSTTGLRLRTLLLAAASLFLATSTALTQDSGALDFESCRAIQADQPRLDCFRKLLSSGESKTAADDKPAKDLWPLIKTPRPEGRGEAVAIMRTADTAQSDPDFAGLIIRCGERQQLEVVLALIKPLPPLSKHEIVMSAGAEPSTLQAETTQQGTALALPIDAMAFTTGAWREAKDLSIKIIDPEGDIKGIIALDGVGPAIAKLTANCPLGVSK